MKTTRISRIWKVVILTIFIILVSLSGFWRWLTEYSFEHPLGPAKQTSQSDSLWSPDGKYIAFLCGYSYPFDGLDLESPPIDTSEWGRVVNDVCIVDWKTRQIQRLTYGRDKWNLIMSPDGKMLAWYDARSETFEVYDVTKQKILAKVKTKEEWYRPFWSLDSKRIVSSCGNIALDVPTGNILITPSALSFDVALSPNEKYLAFTQQVRPEITTTKWAETEAGKCVSPDEWQGIDEILVIIENGKIKYKSDFMVYGWPFVWSPDSSLFIVEKETEDARDSDMAIVYAPTGEVVSLDVSDAEFFWSPSGNKLAYKTEDAIAIIEIKFSTNPFSYEIIKEQSYPLPGSPEYVSDDYYLDWSPDERHIVFTLHQLKERVKDNHGEAFIYNAGKIWVLDLETGEIEPLLPEN